MGVGIVVEGLVARARLRPEDIGTAVVVVTIIVNNDHEIGGAVEVVEGVELEIVPALRAVKGTGIDFDCCCRIESDYIGRTTEGAEGSGLEVDGAVGLDGRW